MTGSSSLSGRSLAIVRELWLWREQEAQRRDCPSRQILRDDLIVELASRRSADVQQIRAPSAASSGATCARIVPDLARAIGRALAS